MGSKGLINIGLTFKRRKFAIDTMEDIYIYIYIYVHTYIYIYIYIYIKMS